MRQLVSLLALSTALGACSYETHHTGAGQPLLGDGGAPYEEGEAPLVAADGGGAEREEPTETRVWHPDPAVAAAIDAWRWRGETVGDVPDPDTDRCVNRFDDLEIVVPPHNEFRRLCHRCDLTDDSPHCESLGRVNGCAPWGGLRGDDGVVGDRHALIVLDATIAAEPVRRDRLVIHEAIHHLGECTPSGPDAPHDNDTWWCSDDPSCITARAQGSLSR